MGVQIDHARMQFRRVEPGFLQVDRKHSKALD